MCGLSGVYSPTALTIGEVDKLTRLVFLSHYRGSDSTGFFGLTEPRAGVGVKVNMWKDKVHPLDFIAYQWDEMLKTMFKDGAPNALAFHTRAATKGDISKENAHPFKVGSITGEHNGTFNTGLKYEKDFKTDSEALFKEIDEIGLPAFVKKDKAFGAMALVFYNSKDKTLNFYRNTQRPLHFLASGRCLYWASEARDLINALNIIGPVIDLDVTDSKDIEERKIFSLPPETQLSIDITKCDYSWSAKKLDKPVYATTVSDYGYEQGSNFYRGTIQPRNVYRQQNQKEIAAARLEILTDNTKMTPFKYKNFDIRRLKTVEVFIDSSVICSLSMVPSSYKEWEREAAIVNGYWSGSEVRYAVELNAYIACYRYEQLCVFRRANPELFLAKLQSVIGKMNKPSKMTVCRLLGLSLNSFRQIVKGNAAFKEFVDRPYSHRNNCSLIIYKTIAEVSDRVLKDFKSKEDPNSFSESAASAIIDATFSEEDFNDTLPFRVEREQQAKLISFVTNNTDTGLRYSIYPVRRLVSFAMFQQATREGCCNCGGGVSTNSDLYWISNSDFLCEECQEKLSSPEGEVEAGNLGLYNDMPSIKEQIIAREITAQAVKNSTKH